MGRYRTYLCGFHRQQHWQGAAGDPLSARQAWLSTLVWMCSQQSYSTCTSCAEKGLARNAQATLCSSTYKPPLAPSLQKEATGSLPRFSLDTNILRQYFRSRRWLAGLAADFGGALLMIAAFALAPVSLVQPVSGVGLVSLAVYSHVWLKACRLPLAKRSGALWCRTPGPADSRARTCGVSS